MLTAVTLACTLHWTLVLDPCLPSLPLGAVGYAVPTLDRGAVAVVVH
jgi:hypothetical protein